GGRRGHGVERWPPRRGAHQGEGEEEHEYDTRESTLGRELEVIVVGMIPDAPLDGRRLVRTEGMQPRAETGAEQRMVADDRPACRGCIPLPRAASAARPSRRRTRSMTTRT